MGVSTITISYRFTGPMSKRFKIERFVDPAFVTLLYDLLKDFNERVGSMSTPEDMLRYIAKALFVGAPMRVYVVFDGKENRIVGLAVLLVGDFPPRLWVEIFHIKKEYAKYGLAKKLWKKIYEDMQKEGVKELFCTVKDTARARLFRKAGFKPAEIVLRCEVKGECVQGGRK